MSDKKTLVWFRNDLRIHDHQPLIEALKKSECIIPVFCIDPRWQESTPLGTLKVGFHRFQFLLESLTDLKKNFQELGGDLLIKTGKPEELIPQICVEYGVQAVYAFKEVASEEVRIGDRLESNLWKHKIPLNLYLGNTLYNKEDLPFPIKDIPDVFSNFRKRTERDSFVREILESPVSIKVPENLEKTTVPPLSEFGFNELNSKNRSSLFVGGETEGLKRMQDYFWQKDLLKEYKNTRNGLLGDDYSSKFSPWLSFGCLSPRKVYWEIKKYEKERVENDSTYWLVFELLWRDYFRFMFKKYGNALFREDGIKKVKRTNIAANEEELFEKWKEGKTGIPFIDANMLELKHTGFMSNRGRQNVASFLINDLHVTWTKGAAWFEENLIDYNPASNWGNWAYLAGVGNDPREERYFNVLKQAYDYDAKGEYVKHWFPKLCGLSKLHMHQPWRMSEEEQRVAAFKIGIDYPEPIVKLTFNF
jgi:deoxyribodipyrimidine photo-lyase